MNELGQAIVERLIAASIGGGVALSIALAATLTLKRLSPTVLCWIWRLAVVKLLVSFVWLSPIEIHILRGVAPAALPPPVVRVSSPSREVATHAVTPTPRIEQVTQMPVLTASTAVAGVWTLGLLVMVAGAFVGSVRSRRFIRSSERVQNEQATSLLQACRTSAGVRRTPALLSSADAISPVLVGIWRPAIILPSMLLKEGRESELRLALAHELSHIKRLDPWWAGLFSACRALLFFHPLIWLSGRPWSLAQEAACDAETLTWADISPAAYAESLVNLARMAVARTTTGLAVVPVYSQKEVIKRRLAWIESSKPLSRRVRTGLALGLTLVGAFGIVPWRLASVASAATHAPAKQDNAPQAIGEIDWSTPTLAPGSSAESGGFRVLKIERQHEDGLAQLDYNGMTLYANRLMALTTTVWIEIPRALREPHVDEYDFLGKDFSLTLSAKGTAPLTGPFVGGYASHAELGLHQAASILCVSLPIGYSEALESMRLQIGFKGKEKASWIFTNLPKTPASLPSDIKLDADKVIHGIHLHAVAWRDVKTKSPGIDFGVIQGEPIPKGEHWDIGYGPPTFDRLSTIIFGDTPGIQDLDPPVRNPMEWTQPAFLESLNRIRFHVDLTRYATEDESVTLSGLGIEPARHAVKMLDGEVNYQVVNRKERTIRTPSGLSFRLPVQDGNTPCRAYASMGGEQLFIQLTPNVGTDHDVKLEASSLWQRYHLPLSLSVQADGFGHVLTYWWKDGHLELQLDEKNLKPGPVPPIKLTFTQRVDLEHVPLDFVAPIVDHADWRKPAKQAN